MVYSDVHTKTEFPGTKTLASRSCGSCSLSTCLPDVQRGCRSWGLAWPLGGEGWSHLVGGGHSPRLGSFGAGLERDCLPLCLSLASPGRMGSQVYVSRTPYESKNWVEEKFG